MTSRSLELIHMDLFGLTKTKSLSVVLFSFLLTIFLDSLGFSFWKLSRIFMLFENEWKKKKDFPILRIRSDRGGEFVSHFFITYREKNGIKHELNVLEHNKIESPKGTPRDHLDLISRYRLSQYLWAETVNTSCYISKRIYFYKKSSKTNF